MSALYTAPTGDFVTSTLNGAISSSSTSFTIGTGLALPATNGILFIHYDSIIALGTDNGPETVTYTAYNTSNGAVSGVVRGAANTTAVAHVSGATIASGPSALQIAALINGTGFTTGIPVQTVETDFSAVATGTTTVPYDDTIPQNTEGDQYMTQAITPKNASNLLIIEVSATVAVSAAGVIATCLFQDSTAGALATTATYAATANAPYTHNLRYVMTAGTTSSTTFKIRIGNQTAGTTTFNGDSASRRFGAIPKSSIKITEISG